MKKVLAVVIVLCFAATGFAAWGIKKPETKAADTKAADTKAADTKASGKKTKKEEAALVLWTGKVISLNEPQNELVIKESKTTYDKVLIVKPEVFKAVKLGDEVQVALEPDSNIVKEFKITNAAPVEKPVGDATKGDTSQHKR